MKLSWKEYIWEVTLRLLVYGFGLAMGLAFLFFVFLCAAHADSVAVLQWEVETSKPAPYNFDIYRGETVYLEPQYLSYQEPVDLSDVYEVVLRYRDSSLPEGYYYAITGAVSDAETGKIKITWDPDDCGTNSIYLYSLVSKATNGDSFRGFGTIKIKGTVSGSVTQQPDITTTFDWAAVEHINILSAPFLTDVEIDAMQDEIDALGTSKVDVVTFEGTNALLQAAIDEAKDMATMGGDVTGPSTNATVIKIRTVPVGELAPEESQDGYGIKYDHATGTLILGPVASEGSTISNILILTGTAAETDVSFGQIGVYQITRPGDLPSIALNAGGSEIAYVDLLGITLKAGSLHLLSDFLAVNPSAYDGSVSAPAYTWEGQLDLGKYRLSYGGGYGEGFCVGSNLVWFWGEDGIHLTNGAALFGLQYDSLEGKPDLGSYLTTSNTRQSVTLAPGGSSGDVLMRGESTNYWSTPAWLTSYLRSIIAAGMGCSVATETNGTEVTYTLTITAGKDWNAITNLPTVFDGGATGITAGASDVYDSETRTLTWNAAGKYDKTGGPIQGDVSISGSINVTNEYKYKGTNLVKWFEGTIGGTSSVYFTHSNGTNYHLRLE